MERVKTRKEENPFGPMRKSVYDGLRCTECGKTVGWPSFDSVYDEGKLLCLECFSRTGKEKPRPVIPGLRELCEICGKPVGTIDGAWVYDQKMKRKVSLHFDCIKRRGGRGSRSSAMVEIPLGPTKKLPYQSYSLRES